MAKYTVCEGKINNHGYGIYDYLGLRENIKTYGIFLDDKYIFETDIADHHAQASFDREKYGDYKLYISTHYDCYYTDIYINITSDRAIKYKPSIFQYKCILGILEECKKYKDENDLNLRIKFSDNVLIRYPSNNEDIDEMINLVNKSIDVRRKEMDMEIKRVEDAIFTPDVDLQIYDIDKLIRFFSDKFSLSKNKKKNYHR